MIITIVGYALKKTTLKYNKILLQPKCVIYYFFNFIQYNIQFIHTVVTVKKSCTDSQARNLNYFNSHSVNDRNAQNYPNEIRNVPPRLQKTCLNFKECPNS